MSVADNVHTEQTRINHDFKMVRHTRFWPAQAQDSAGKILFSRKGTYESQSQRITERLKYLRQI